MSALIHELTSVVLNTDYRPQETADIHRKNAELFWTGAGRADGGASGVYGYVHVARADLQMARRRVSFTELNGLNQYISGRAGITLGAAGLAATAGGLMERFHPNLDQIAPGVLPLALYAAIIAIPAGAAFAVSSLFVDVRLQNLLAENSGDESQSGENQEIEETELKEIKSSQGRKLWSLDLSLAFTSVGVMALIIHGYELFAADHFSLTQDSASILSALASTMLAMLAVAFGIQMRRRRRALR